MEITWTDGHYDEIDVPNLYKFREWDNAIHQTILTKQEVYLSPPSGFKDPLDCKIPIRFDLLTHRELNKRFFDDSVKRHPSWSKSRHKKWAKHWMRRTPIKNPDKYRQMEKVVDGMFDKNFGVLCLTPEIGNYELWEQHTTKHTGFCVGFVGKELLRDASKFGMTGYVDYHPKLPIIHPNEDYRNKAAKRAFSKLQRWDYEKEYRTTKIRPVDEIGDEWRKVKVPSDQFVEVVFDAEMPESNKNEILKLVKGISSNIKIKEAKIDPINRTVTISDAK
ncbi:MAG: hypothetical protein ACKVU0_12715 [Saprospiraceae bacterium]